MGLFGNGLFNTGKEPEEIRSRREVYAHGGKYIGSTKNTRERQSKREAERMLRDHQARQEGGEIGRTFLGFGRRH